MTQIDASAMNKSRWLPRHMRALSALLAVAVLLGACSDLPESNEDPLSPHADETAVSVRPSGAFGDVVSIQRPLSDSEVTGGPTVQELGMFRYFREIGVLGLLESYLVNLPPTAGFLFRYEHARIGTANNYFYADTHTEGEIAHEFERVLLGHAYGALQSLESLPPTSNSQKLHDAFYAAMEECGRDSPWPDVELFVIHLGVGGEMTPELVEPSFGLSYHEFIELRHECARYAATYPALGPEVRDELLAPQREHYAKVILDRLDNELPHVEVPADYQAGIDDLRQNGW